MKDRQWKRIYNALDRLAKSEKKRRNYSYRWDSVYYKNGFFYATNEFAGIRVWIPEFDLKDNELHEDITYYIDENGDFNQSIYDAPPLEKFLDECLGEGDGGDFAFDPKLAKYVLDVFQACKVNPICKFNREHLMISFRGSNSDMELEAMLMCVRM